MTEPATKTGHRAGVRDALGRPMRDLRISVIDNCNLRCPYCMPQDEYGDHYQFLRRDELMSFDEIARVAQASVELGVRKFRITGGEPLLRKNVDELIHRLTEIPGAEDLALTTNGLLLPRLAQRLNDAGLRRITVSLDSLDDDVFGRMSGRGVKVASVLEGIEAAQRAGFESIKINTVIQRGVNDHTALHLAERFRHTGCVLRFIEYMDVGNQNGWRLEEVVSAREIHDQLHARYPLRPLEPNYRGEVATRYAYEDGAGEIGFISSVTNTFCGDCSRARLSADGKLFTCLFAGSGTDVRSLLRSGATDDDLAELLYSVWRGRTDRYSELRAAMTDYEKHRHKVEMFQIGG